MAQIPARKCGFCNNAVAALYCEGCHQILCVECRQNVHDKVPFLQDHKVTNIQKEGNRVFRPQPVCKTHKNRFVYYCSKCECLTCAECMTSNHNEHKTEKIKTVADARRQTVIQYIEKIKSKVEIVKKKLETIDTEHSAQIKSDCESYIATVSKTMGEIYEIIDRYKVIHLTTASDFTDIENQDLERKKTFFKRLHDDTADRLLKFENLLLETHDSTFLTEWKALQTDVQINDEETDDPLVAPKRIDSFNQKKLTRSVIDEIDENFKLRLKENEQKVNELQEENDKLKEEIKLKHDEIEKLSKEFRAKSDVDNKRMTSLSVKIKEYEVMFNDTKINNRPTTVTESDHERESDFKQPTSFLRQRRPIKPKDTFQSIDTSFPAFSDFLEDCVICMDTPEDPRKLNCGHIFCQACIGQHFKLNNPVCPTCGSIQGEITGNQPPGTMKVYRLPSYLSGYPRCGRIVIEYDIPGGYQGKEHKTPGRLYEGIKRSGYLPDNEKGQLVAKMLRIAFDRKLVFTIGDSRTTGKQGVVTWNDIHHKTNPNPHGQFGYPDETYLDRVIDELSAKGVTEKDVGPDTKLY